MVKNIFSRFIPSKRRIIQLYAALLYNAHLKGFVTGEIFTGKIKALCVPGLNCYSCPAAVGACPLGALQNGIASSRSRMPTYILGIILLYGIILGRTICGWLCPMGLIQDLLHRIPTPKLGKNRVTRILSGLKYILLAVFVVIIPLLYGLRRLPLPAFCKYICPAGTLEGAIGLLSHPENSGMFSMLGALFTGKFVILALTVGVCVFVYRAFCRFLCPLGAIYGLFSKINIVGVKAEPSKCIGCGKCVAVCKTDIRHVGDRECIHCGECVSCCPTGAIGFRAGKINLMPRDDAPPSGRKLAVRAAAWAAALLVLVCSVYFTGRTKASDNEQITASATTTAATFMQGITSTGADIPASTFAQKTEIGASEGAEASDFTVPLYGGGSFTLSEHRGKIVVINFWATWCTPCCAELPYFDEIAKQYPEDVVVIALHSDLVTDDVDEYLAAYDYSIPFGLDETGEVIASFEGGMVLPQTVVLDRNGTIVYNTAGSLTYEKLSELVKLADK